MIVNSATPDDSVRKMFKAAKAGETATIRELLAADPALVGVRDGDECTPLHYAAWKGHAEAAALLLDAGADVNAENTNGHWGSTPLHAAAHGGQSAVAILLIARGADLQARNPSGKTPLQETAVHNARAVARILKEQGATE